MTRILRLILCLSMACLLFSGCGKDGGLFNISLGDDYSQYSMLKEAGYYRHLVMLPNGDFAARFKVNETEAKKGLVYKVELNAEKNLEKITALFGGKPYNANWACINNHFSTLGIVTVEYQGDYIKYNFKDARMKATSEFYGAYSIRFKIGEDKRKMIAYRYDDNGVQSKRFIGYSQMLFTYNDKGGLFKVGYANVNGERVTTDTKGYETRFRYADDKKAIFPKEIANYGKDGGLMNDRRGIAKTVYTYDKQGRLIEARHFGSDETPKEKKLNSVSMDADINAVSAGVITRYSYDDNKYRPRRISFYGKDEQPLAVLGGGKIAALLLGYDGNDMLVSIKALGTDGTAVPLATTRFGDNVVEVRMAYDEYGNDTKYSFFGKNGTMVISPVNKYAEVRYKYDDKRRITEGAFFGTDAKQIGRIVREYNDDDKVTVEILYDRDDKEIKRSTEETRGALRRVSRDIG